MTITEADGKRALWTAALAAGWFTGCGGSAKADLTLSDPDANDGIYSTSALAAASTASDTVSTGGLTGISLWGLLGGAASSTPLYPTYGAIA